MVKPAPLPTNGHAQPGRQGHEETALDGSSCLNSSPTHASAGSPPRPSTLAEIALLLNAEFVGDGSTPITGVAGLDNTLPGSISFIEHEGLLKTALDSSAAAIIAPATMAQKIQRAHRANKKPVVLTGNPRLAFAKVMEFLQPLTLPAPGIHPTAVIEPDAHIGEGVTIREFCYIGHHAHIGDGVVLYPHCVVGDGAQIGNATVLFPAVVINHQVNIGQRVRIHSGTVLGGDGFGYVMDEGKRHKIPQVGTVIIEDDVEIGANVCIDRATLGATRVGAGTKIDNLVQVAHNVRIGRNCILCGQVGLSGSVVLEDDVMLGGQVGARDHVTIGKGATVGAQSGIMTDIKAGSYVIGSPAVSQRDYMKRKAASFKLPDTMRKLRNLERQINALQAELEALRAEQTADRS